MGHYASEMPDYDDERQIAWRLREDKRLKKRLLESIDLLYIFRRDAYTDGVDYELNSILKYYKSKLYDLRHIDLDSDTL